MRVKWFGVALAFMPFIVNASQIETLPEPELLEFLGRYSEQEQAWLELVMKQEQQHLEKDKVNNVSVKDK
ncbi:MAG: hypothetical protein R3354_00345 [Thiohalomonadales bacterium]|nr:hypothetical protein [Thiohalomonadales bacterium]